MARATVGGWGYTDAGVAVEFAAGVDGAPPGSAGYGVDRDNQRRARLRTATRSVCAPARTPSAGCQRGRPLTAVAAWATRSSSGPYLTVQLEPGINGFEARIFPAGGRLEQRGVVKMNMTSLYGSTQ